jgi:hypothetical protein
VGGATYAPCTIGNECTQIPVSQTVCQDNNGVWWGKGYDDPTTQCPSASEAPDCQPVPADGFTECCQVLAWQASANIDVSSMTITPLEAVAIRNDSYKLVQNTLTPYVPEDQSCGVQTTSNEFYAIDEATPNPTLDEDGTQLDTSALTSDQQQAYDYLTAQLQTVLNSEPECPGDGNGDLVVDRKDLRDWRYFANTGGLSSVYDLNLNGLTDAADEAIVQQNLGLDCRATRR